MFNQISRRVFLKGGMSVLSMGAAMPSVFTRAVMDSLQQGATTAEAAGAGTLIVVQMAGGNDGLNTIIPYRDPVYRRVRAKLGFKEEEVVPLDDRLALHPALGLLKPLWDEGRMAVVEGVGYPKPSFSHFQSMDIWQTGDLDQKTRSGWLSRFVEGMVDDTGHVFNGLSIGRSLPPALCCPRVPPAIVDNIDSYRLQPDGRYASRTGPAREQALLRLYDSYATPAPYAAILDATAESAVSSARTLQELVKGYVPGVEYPATGFAQGLKLLAETIASNQGLRVGYIPLGGFDTHANERYEHQRLLATFADGLAAFFQDLAAHGKDQDVVVVTWSEFGRRVGENASGGTDHGTAGPMFLFGTPVRGGFHGASPSLTELDNGNLRYTTDFRSVYAAILEGRLNATPSDVLGQPISPLGVLV